MTDIDPPPHPNPPAPPAKNAVTTGAADSAPLAEPTEPAAAPVGTDDLGRWRKAVSALLVPVAALAIAFGIGAILIRLQGVDPAYAYRTLFGAALTNTDGLLRTLQKATPLILTGLAVVIPLRIGLFNIGAQGQLVFGALGAAWAGIVFGDLPAVVLIPLCLVIAMVLGSVWAWVAGILKATRNVHEVISTIMLNSIALGIIDYLVTGPLREAGQVLPRTAEIAPAAMLSDLGLVPVGFPVAVILAGVVWWLLARTTIGFRFNTVGKNRFAAGYAGIGISRVVVAGMMLAGALAGFGGAIETLGITHRYESGFNVGLGFDGITIALLARSNPLGTIPAALLVGILRSGAATLQFETGIQPEVVDMLLAITLLLVSIPVLAKLFQRRRGAAVPTEVATTQTGGLA